MNDELDLSQLVPEKIVVSAETWDWLNRRLAEPPREIPELRELMSQRRREW